MLGKKMTNYAFKRKTIWVKQYSREIQALFNAKFAINFNFLNF